MGRKKKSEKKNKYTIKDGILEEVEEETKDMKKDIEDTEKISSSTIITKNNDVEVSKTLELIKTTTQKIFHEIVAPICSVPGMNFNIFTAKFSDYDNAIPKYRKQILEKILEEYAIEREILETLQDLPMSLTAMYIVDKSFYNLAYALLQRYVFFKI